MKCDDCKTKRNLNCRVTIQRVKDSPDRDGNQAYDPTVAANWETYCTRWAEILTRGGSERFASDMIQSGQTHRIYMRADATTRAIMPQMRVMYGERVMAILAVEDVDQRHQWMQVDVAEEKAA